MSTMVETIQAIIREELRSVRTTELGIVEEVYPHRSADDKDNYACDVLLKNSGLLLKRVPIATGHIGTVAIPNIGDLVLVAFDHGDVNQPIVIGRLYNDADRPPLNDTDEVIFRLPLAEADDKTIKGAIRNHQDQSPPREIIVEMPPKITLRIVDGTITATAGSTEMRLDQPGGSGGTVTVVAGRTTITMDQDGDVAVDAAGSMELTAAGDMTLTANNVTIKGRLRASVEAGTQATLKGLTATVDGSATTTVRGGLISVQGVTSFSP